VKGGAHRSSFLGREERFDDGKMDLMLMESSKNDVNRDQRPKDAKG
jgi:hypothetical protein